MFPVPDHLPGARRAGENVQNGSSTSSSAPDPVLDLLDPLLSVKPTSAQARAVKEELERAITHNKARGHELVISNFPSISSHIRLGSQIQDDFGRIQHAVNGLEREINPSDTDASFIPPLLNALNKHFTSKRTLGSATDRAQALKGLQIQVNRVRQVEEAVYAGRGADASVLQLLQEDPDHSGDVGGNAILRGTRVKAAIHMKLFLSMVTEQVGDAFVKAVSFSPSTDGLHGTTLNVLSEVSLQQPRIPRPEEASSPRIGTPSPYQLWYIYKIMDKLGSLQQHLQTLQQRILKDVILPIVDPSSSHFWRVSVNSSDHLSTLRLDVVRDERIPEDVLTDISTILNLVDTKIFPPPPQVASPERERFLSSMRATVYQAVLDHLLIPSLPESLQPVPKWLEMVRKAMDAESNKGNEVIRPFFETAAGPVWANRRRRKIGEEVRKLVIGGWEGWEAVEGKREREVVGVVEIEVEDVDEVQPTAPPEKLSTPTEVLPTAGQNPSTNLSDRMDVDRPDDDGDGWDFERPIAGPSKPKPATPPINGDASIDDGWAFDDPVEAAPPPPPAAVIAKPAREAKRLGKKVAKSKPVVDDDPWGSDGDSSMNGTGYSVSEDRHTPLAETTSPSIAAETGEAGDGWGWAEEQKEPPRTATPPKKMKKVFKEERRKVEERYLVSKACSTLLDIASRALKEAHELTTISLSSPSFSSAETILLQSATDSFDLYRSLIRTVYAPQIRDVPTLAMQSYNDSLHLSSSVLKLHEEYPNWTTAEDVSRRLKASGEHAFETQVGAQKDGLMEVLNDTLEFVQVGEERNYGRCERCIRKVVDNLESLERVLRVVLPMSTHFEVIGYLLDTVVHRISTDILSLPDITEVESNRLHDLIGLVIPLEAMFVLEPGQPSSVVSQVHHWLKFCYIAEILQANLVDITYLFDTGALVDFSTEELVGIVRALFADSEKREGLVERIEGGRGVGVQQNLQ